ncbi:MAG: hypothetical protein CVU71_16365 [Deltaproteobacteria bacterium HGW-Deltaproteobacteria-6]|jgi:uncharacterized membrane protein (DUF373 family)|nr:MAG: hypothetical protein CVU71_16365 [Deltaproteobacteria bacterium HGW-Deltaproteobacteria-6]
MSGTDQKLKNFIIRYSKEMLRTGDSILYAFVGISFLLAALVSLFYSYWDFSTIILNVHEPRKAAEAIIRFVSDLLLVIIVMEVMGTVIHYLEEHRTSLRPFLNIGIVSATRGILSISAKLSVETLQGQNFINAMIELIVNVTVILILGITLKLLSSALEMDEQKEK